MINLNGVTDKEIQQGWIIRRKNNKIIKINLVKNELKNTLKELNSKGQKDNVEYMAVIKDNKIVGKLNTLNDNNKVKMSEEQIKEVSNNPDSEYFIAHNHSANKSIEPFDLQIMDEYKNVKGVVVTTNNRDYIFVKNDKMQNIFDGINDYMYNNIDSIKDRYPKLKDNDLQFIGLVNAFKSMGGKIIYIEKA